MISVCFVVCFVIYQGTSLSKGLPENKLYPLMSAGDAALPGVAVEDA